MMAILQFLFASLPLTLLVLLMLALRWSAAKAGAVGLAAALLLSWTHFGFVDSGRLWATVGSLLEAIFTAAQILWIIFAALCLHYLQLCSGATDTLRRGVFTLARSPATVVLMVAWFFALFMEGAAGFGTPVALAAPMLVTLGVRSVDAVAVALVWELAQQLLVLLGAGSAHLVGFIHDDQVPVAAQQALFGIVHARDPGDG